MASNGYVRASLLDVTEMASIGDDDDTVDMRISAKPVDVFQAARNGDEDTVLGALMNKYPIDSIDVNGDTLIHHAVRGNYVDLVISLLNQRKPPNINIRNNSGLTPLLVACHECHVIDVSILQRLLSHKPSVDVNATDADGDAALHIVARVGNPEYAVALVSKQTELSLQIDQCNSAGATPLMIAAVQGDSTSRVAVVRALLSAKPQPDVNAVNSNGLVVAQSIIIKGYVRMLDALLSLAPKTDRRVRRPESGDTLLHLAASRTKSTDLIRVLVHYGPDMLDIDAVDDRGESALHVVLRTSPFNLESLKQLLKLTPASSISSALQLACELRIAPAVRVLLMELQQPVSNDLIQLVHHWGSELASHESDDDVVRQTELKTQQCIEGMLNAHHQQQDVDAFLAESRNVPVHEFVQPWIHEAARARDFKLLQYCLDHGVNINATDRQFGNTPLLLGCDAHADNTSLDGETSSAQSGGFWMTADFNNTHMLLDEEDGVIDRSQASTSATRVYEPIPALAPPAVDLEFVRRILQVRECDINAQNRAGTTALMAAVSLGPSHMALVEVLCSQQPPPQLNLVNRAGCTALMLAALIGHESAVRLLLQRRADVDVRDNSGAKASQLAANDTIRMMLEQVETNSNCMIS